jgi:hypothetical protein
VRYDEVELLSHWQESTGCHSSNIIVYILQTPQDGRRQQGKKHLREIL